MMCTDPLHNTHWPDAVPLLARGGHLHSLQRVQELRRTETVYPAQDELFAALTLTPPETVRVVIVGQDPYHGPNQAHGLAFSVRQGRPVPPSLANIFKEIRRDVYANAVSASPVTDLTRWAQQGVLLLNTVLSVAAHRPRSHLHLGWQTVTRAILEFTACAPRPVAALLWGKDAQAYTDIFAAPRHLVLKAAHPSPLSASRGFFGCGHFSKTDAWLKEQGEETIVW